MSPEFVDLVMGLCQGPGFGPKYTPREFLRLVGEPDGTALALRILNEAISEQSSLGVEMACILGSVFGVSDEFVEPLSLLVVQDWHISHEDAVGLLDDLRSPAAIPALEAAAGWIPTHLEWDDAYAFGRKAVYALSKIDHPQAREALAHIARETPGHSFPVSRKPSCLLRKPDERGDPQLATATNCERSSSRDLAPRNAHYPNGGRCG